MTFEKALEAMKRGKKVYRKAWKNTEMDSIYLSNDNLFTMTCDDVFTDDWKIYEDKRETLTFPEAVEALKQGKCVRHETWENDECINSLTSCVSVGDCVSGKWEIYEEPQKEPEMTALCAVQQLFGVIEYCYIHAEIEKEEHEQCYKSFKIIEKALKNQNQPEKKCECKCNCEKYAPNLQEGMKQALCRKFFELEQIEKDSLAVSNMLDIYRLLYEVG